jgi:hypothetical protein
MGSDKEINTSVKLQRIQRIYGTIIRTSARTVMKETLPNFCKIVAISTFVCGCSVLDADRMAKDGLEAAEMRSLRAVSG